MTYITDFDPVAFLERMLRISSLSGQEGELAHFLVAEMQRLGFESFVDDAGNAVGGIGEPSGWARLTLGYKGRLLVEGRWEQPMAHSAGRDVAVAERAVAFWNAVQSYCAARGAGKVQLFEQLLPSLRAIHSGSDGLTD